MIDRKSGTMEGITPADKKHLFENRFEGVMYTIEQFQVLKGREKYGAIEHPFRISFAQKTEIHLVVPQPENFPVFGYTAYPLSQLGKCIKQNVQISDSTLTTTASSTRDDLDDLQLRQ